MVDQCKHCTARGNFKYCTSIPCFQHENWIATQHRERYANLKEVAVAMREWIDAAKRYNLTSYAGI